MPNLASEPQKTDFFPINEKAVRLIEYLLKISSLNTRIIRKVEDYQRLLWLSDIPDDQNCYSRATANDFDQDDDDWIEVATRNEPQIPDIPGVCKNWVEETTLANKHQVPSLLEKIKIHSSQFYENDVEYSNVPSSREENLNDHPEIQNAWKVYIKNKWLPWVHDHDAWEKLQQIYSQLFTIRQEQKKLGEEYELVLGFGLLTWQQSSGQIVRRHLLVADVQLDFRPRKGIFVIQPNNDGVKLRVELDMLDVDDHLISRETSIKQDLANAKDNPWDKENIQAVLSSLVHAIDPSGEYDDSLYAPKNALTKPIVTYAPALILRKRSTKGLNDVLKKIKEQIENGGKISSEFADLSEIINHDNNQIYNKTSNKAIETEIFFPKPSNDEQRLIVDKIKRANGVIVQGPPGTGKSHTIVNLVSHLLATGQRILITAKTPRALKVLEGLLPDALHPLCINLLGVGIEEQKSLSSSIDGILKKTDVWNQEEANKRKNNLESKLQELRSQKVVINNYLQDVREQEIRKFSIANGRYVGTAADIAKQIQKECAEYEWFTDRVEWDRPCVVATSDLLELLKSLRKLNPQRRTELSLLRPDGDGIISSDDFAKFVARKKQLDHEAQSSIHSSNNKMVNILCEQDKANVIELRDQFLLLDEKCKHAKSLPFPWIAEAHNDILRNNTHMWTALYEMTNHILELTQSCAETLDNVNITYPENILIKTLYEDASQIYEHLASGGKFRQWGIRPKIVRDRKYIFNSVKIDGKKCKNIEDFKRLKEHLAAYIEIEKIWNLWKGKETQTEETYFLQLVKLKSLNEVLGNLLSIGAIIGDCKKAIKKCNGLPEPPWTEQLQFEDIVLSCNFAIKVIENKKILEELTTIELALKDLSCHENVHPITKELLDAIRSLDVDNYAKCINILRTLNDDFKENLCVDDYVNQIREKLPRLVNAIENSYMDSKWDEHVLKIDKAWDWAYAHYWIEDFIGKGDIDSLRGELKRIDTEIMDCITEVASVRAWSFCFNRLSTVHKRHMESWKQSMKRIGKGTGKHAPRHRRDAQNHLNNCRDAVPAWVMPLHRVWDTVPPHPEVFDIIIVDEASQCGLEALPLFYLGKKIIIVGDDKQISPDAVGLQRETAMRLRDEYLHDFKFKSAFDVESSLFDHAKRLYDSNRVTLREHFRCMPEIIRFSNELCYSDTPLIPLRQYGPDRLPPIEHVFVNGGYRERSNSFVINRPEANAIVERIVGMCSDPKFDNKSIGVVVLQGDGQADLIERQLLEKLGSDIIDKRNIVCGNPYSFQGDERDIIFLSLVAAPNARTGVLSTESHQRRFNVAASRAKDMMILYHSVTSNDLSDLCLRKQLLDFFEDASPKMVAGIDKDELEKRAFTDNRQIVRPPKPFDSWFEVDVALELARKNYHVIAQHEVANKRIDLVVEGGQARLAIECDGDYWHGAAQYEADMRRQRQLERCGWEFYRVRESAFYINKASALAKLWPLLEERNILPST